jgi:hypothetical protein
VEPLLDHWKVEVEVLLLEGDDADAESKGNKGDDKLVAHLDDVGMYSDVNPQPKNHNDKKLIQGGHWQLQLEGVNS